MSRSGVVFPYGITLREGGVLDTFPAAEISFFSQTGEQFSLFLLIDSGATISALPASDAPTLGVNKNEGTPMRIAGIDGKTMEGWRHEVKIGIGGTILSIPFVFLENKEAPRILGREGVFDRFCVLLQEAKRRTGVVRNNTKESRVIDRVLDTLA
jgi:hypothetical protein